MGNSCCCPSSNPCDHTVDETQGLLNSPDSKVTSRPITTEGVSQTLEVEESKNEADEKDAVATQPGAAPMAAEVPIQSSYGSVIQMLHTDASLAAQTSPSASPVSNMTKEPVDLATTDTATNKKEIQTPASKVTDTLEDKAPNNLATDKEKPEIADQVINTLIKEEKEGERKSTGQDATAECPADELHGSQVDTQKEISEDTEKRPAEADQNEDYAEINRNNECGEVNKETEELKTPAEGLPEKDSLPTKQPVLNISTTDKTEIEGLLTSMNIAENKANPLLTDNSRIAPRESLPESLYEVEETISAKEKLFPDKMLDNDNDVVLSMAELKGDSLPHKTQETSEQEFSPAVNINEESTVNYTDNGKMDSLTVQLESPAQEVDVEVAQLILPEPYEPLSENQELMREPSADSSTAEKVEKPETTDTAEVQKTITESVKNEDDGEAFQNGLHTHAHEKNHRSTEKLDIQISENEPENTDTGPCEALGQELTEEMEVSPQASDSYETAAAEENAEVNQANREEIIFSSSHDVKVSLIPVNGIETIAEKEELKENEDLYRGDDETEQEQAKENKKSMQLLMFTIPGVVEKCSLADPVDILEYSEREWKGNTAKSNLIRKGYSEISCSFTGLRRVRGDNYCSLRATLYQVLATTTHVPAWLLDDDFTLLPEKIEAQEHLMGMWVFPPQCVRAGEKDDAVKKLKHYMGLLQKRWQVAAETESLDDKLDMCDNIFQGGEEEYGLLEVVKFLMLVKAVELHRKMQTEQEVPVFCWLLFARDTSENPRMFFSNHLSQVGFNGGLEQVEMFLLGYALQHTIQAFRLYKSDTEEFVTHYPDDHKHDWPCVCIITEDDRHYNVPVRKPTQYKV